MSMSNEYRSALATIDGQSDRTYALHQKIRYRAPVAHLHQRLRGVPLSAVSCVSR
jgi:hypothetical protein